MPNAARVKFNVTNLSQNVSQPSVGISFVQGITERGPFVDPKDVITSWTQFKRLYGGLLINSDFPLLCKRTLEKGGLLRVSRVGHFTDPSSKASLTATKSALTKVQVITFSDELVTGNKINMKVNGTSIDEITFTTDSDHTMQLIATAIEENIAVQMAEVIDEGADEDRVILVWSNSNTDIAITDALVTLGASQATVVVTNKTGILDINGNILAVLAPKYAGVDYNKLSVAISAASNGSSSYFNLAISHSGDSTLDELYENLSIDGHPTVALSTWLDKIITDSNLMEVTYSDLSSLTGTLRPVNSSYYLAGGSDGGAVVDADYIGDSAGATGLHAFNPYGDALQICTPGIDTMAVHIAGAAYAANRKDLQYYIHLANSNDSVTELNAARDASAINTKYAAFFGGGVYVTDPLTSKKKAIDELAEILALAANSDSNFGTHYSFAGPNRGIIDGILGIVNNYGGNGQYADLNLLANHQINMVINRNNTNMLWGNFSAQLKDDAEKFNNIVRLVISIQKALKPTCEQYIEEPNDVTSFKSLWLTVKPYLDSLVTARALYEYSWEGDQNAQDLDSLQINNKTDVGNGKYKVQLKIKPIPSMQEIIVNIIITAAGVSFDQV